MFNDNNNLRMEGVRLVLVVRVDFSILDRATSALGCPLDHQRSSCQSTNLACSRVMITQFFHIFESKQFRGYQNGCNTIILVNYNLLYIFRIFYDFL
jgi:hypothetical protein